MELIKHLSNGIKDCLIESAIKQEMIEISKYQRGIGKTHALISFAKQYGFSVIVPYNETAKRLKEFYNYPKIYGQDDRSISGKCVSDESVYLELFRGKEDIKIITGFILKD